MEPSWWRVEESRAETQDFSSALKYLLLNFMTLLLFFFLDFLVLVSPCLTTLAASSCHLRAIYVLSPIVNLCHFVKTAQLYALGKNFILIQDYFKCLPVCVPVLVHTSKPHQTASLASLRASASSAHCHPQQLHATQAMSPLQTPKLCPNYYFFLFSTRGIFFFMKKMADFFYRKKKIK